MKDSFYFKHDVDSREDQEKMRPLLMRLGMRGYGIFWALVEDLHHNDGRLVPDFKAFSWTYREPEADIKAVVDDFGLFYRENGKIRSKRVDREREERQEAQKQAKLAGKASAAARKAQRALNDRSTDPQPGEERRGEDRREEEKTTAGQPQPGRQTGVNAPSAVDLSAKLVKQMDAKRVSSALEDARLPFDFGEKPDHFPRGFPIRELPPETCRKIIQMMPRLGRGLRDVLNARIGQKLGEMSPSQLKAAGRREL